MKKSLLALTMCFFASFSLGLHAKGNLNSEISSKQGENSFGYSDPKFGHDSNVLDHIDSWVSEGKRNLSNLYNDQDMDEGSLIFSDSWVENTKLAPLREKLSIVTGGVRNFLNWLNDTAQYEESRKSYLAKIVTMMWGVFGESVDNQEGFFRGSYKIIDPDYKLYEFLLGYVKLVTGSQDPKTLSYKNTTSNHAYRRSPAKGGSSHYKNECLENEQFGIDIRREGSETTLKILPAGKTHILFGRIHIPGIDLPLTFVKFEEVGMGGLGEFVAHSLNFGASGCNVKDKDRREKDVPALIREAFGFFCDNLDAIDGEYIVIVDTAARKEIQNKGTIYDMVNFIRDHYSEMPESEEFIAELENMFKSSGYSADHFEIRSGLEVILDHRTIKN